MLFDDLAAEFEEWFKRETSPKTQSCYANSLHKLRRIYEGKDIATIKLNGRPVGFTILDMRVLKRMLHLAAEWGYLDRLPVIHIPSERQRTRFFSEDEIDALFNECYDPDMRMALRVALGTGLRKNDLLDLRWGQIDFINDLIHVIQKGGRELWVPIDPALTEHLRRHRDQAMGEFVFARRKNYTFRLKSLCKRLGIKDVSFHTLRHTYASHLAMNGVDIKTISELLGHTSIQTTARYTHISTEHKRKAISALPTKITA